VAGGREGVAVDTASPVPTVEMAVSIISASLIVGAAGGLLQAASRMAARDKEINVLPKLFILPLPLMIYKQTPNGSLLFQGGSIRSGWCGSTFLTGDPHFPASGVTGVRADEPGDRAADIPADAPPINAPRMAPTTTTAAMTIQNSAMEGMDRTR
jgi:hypothetical protein